MTMRRVLAPIWVGLAAWGLAVAQEPGTAPVRFNIEAQPIRLALQQFGQQAGLQVAMRLNGKVEEDIKVPPVQGELTAREALDRMLANSGLKYEFVNERAVRVSAVGADTSGATSGGDISEKPAASKTGTTISAADPSSVGRGSTAGVGEQASSDIEELDEIVVTAQRRIERLQDVPIAISVLTGEQLDSLTDTSLTDTLYRVPGVAPITPSLGNPRIVVRGVPSNDSTGGTVGYYVDSVPFGSARLSLYPDMNLYDFERMEVLRGPQGTLYGANSMSGVVRLLTQAPDLNRFEAKTRASVATIEDGGENYRADAAVNIPLIEDRLGVRLVGGYQELGGWIDKPFREDANDGMVKTLRTKLRAKPTEALTVDATAWFSRRSSNAQNIGADDRTTTTPIDEPISSDFDTYSLTAAYDFGVATLTSSTSYIDFEIGNAFSLHLFDPPGSTVTSTSNSQIFSEVFSEELTLQSTTEGPWRWSIGAMYRDAKDRWRVFFNPGEFDLFDYDDRSKSAALFGETTRELLNGKLEATFGLRYFRDEFTTSDNLSPTGTEITSDAVTPRAVLTWHPTDTSTLYASYSQGFRSGLPQTPGVLSDPLFAGSGLGDVKPDKLNNYEIGAKGTLFDGKLALETALYYMDWQDIKVVISSLPPNLITGLVNGPSASGVGVDMALTFRPIDRLEIGGSVSWNDLVSDADVFSGGQLWLSKGDRMSQSPQTTANGFVEYSFPLGNLTGHLHGVVSYLSSWNDITPGPVINASDSITTTSARFTVDSGDRWSASLFGDNLTDENAIAVNQGDFDIWNTRNPPRTIGLQLGYQWN